MIWLFEDKFQDRNFWATLNFGVSNLSKKLFIKLINFVRIPITNRSNEFWRGISSEISKELSIDRSKLNTDFDYRFMSK